MSLQTVAASLLDSDTNVIDTNDPTYQVSVELIIAAVIALLQACDVNLPLSQWQARAKAFNALDRIRLRLHLRAMGASRDVIRTVPERLANYLARVDDATLELNLADMLMLAREA